MWSAICCLISLTASCPPPPGLPPPRHSTTALRPVAALCPHSPIRRCGLWLSCWTEIALEGAWTGDI
eukprot:2031859-Prorocentrum_lima.AAC.1